MTVAMPVTITLDTLAMSNDPTTTIFPYWKLVGLGLEGWYDGATVRTNVEDAPNQDRSFYPGKSLRSAKTMTLMGVVVAADGPTAITQAWDKVAAISPTGLDVALAYTDASGTRYMNVRVAGSAQVQPYKFNGAIFNVPLVAVDPRKFSAPRSTVVTLGNMATTGGLKFPLFNASALLDYGALTQRPNAAAVNAGTAPSYPLFTVNGDMPGGFSVVRDDGATLTYSAAVTLTQPIVIDSSTLRALGGGQNDVTANLSRKDDMSVAANSTHTYTFRAEGSYTGTPQLTVTTTDAWW